MSSTPWTDQHTADLLRLMTSTILAARPAFYAHDSLADVNNNRGDRVNKKAQQLLKKMLEASGVDGAGLYVQEEVVSLAKAKKAGGGSGSAASSPMKGGRGKGGVKEGGRGGEGSPMKKRKVKKEVDEEAEEMEEEEGMDGGLVKAEMD